jgi:hypothetical protein
MTRLQRLAILQWAGLFVAPAAWLGQHLIGQAVAQLRCSVANTQWNVSNTAWQIVLLVVSATLILASIGAAVAVFRATSDADYTSAPPVGRMQMFAIAAMTTNLLLLVIVLLDGIASVVDITCRQS